MDKEELEKEADNWLRKYLLCYNCKRKCTCIQLNAYCEEQILKSYIASAEPREKRIAELEAQIEEMKCCGNCIHCKYDENEESYEYCEKHQQVVNIAIVPCSEYERR